MNNSLYCINYKISNISHWLTEKDLPQLQNHTVTRSNQYGSFDQKLTVKIICTKKPQFQYKPSDLRWTVEIKNNVKLWLFITAGNLNPWLTNQRCIL
jgi:hypothetical protein